MKMGILSFKLIIIVVAFAIILLVVAAFLTFGKEILEDIGTLFWKLLGVKDEGNKFAS